MVVQVVMTITIPRPRADARCWLGSLCRCSTILHAACWRQGKSLNARLITINILTCRESGWTRPGSQVGGAGEASASTQSRALQRRNGCEAGRPKERVLGRAGSGVARSGFGVATWDLGKIQRPSSPTQLSWWCVEPPGRSFSQATPQSEPHTSTYNYTPDSLLQSPSPPLLSSLCVLSLAFVLDTLHSVAD